MYGASSNTILNYNLVRFGVCMIKLGIWEYHWEYLNPMRNLKLLEKYQPSPPPAKKKSQSTRKRKNITHRKSFNHPKIASTIMKKPQTPT